MKNILKNNLFFLITGGCILFVQYLYGGNMKAAIYGLLIAAFIFVCVSMLQIIMLYKQNTYLNNLEDQSENLMEMLPIPADEKEMHYQRILKTLFVQKQSIEQNFESKETDMTDYYTRWIHQIKTPIAALSLLLQGSDLNRNRYKMEEELLLIERYAKMALHYQNLKNTQEDLILKEYEISDLIKTVLKTFSYSFMEKQISLQYEPFSYRTVTDEKWFSFIMEQFLSNAVKYTEKGYVKISFENTEYPVVKIQDTGIGICQEDIPRIFERGYTGFNGHMDKKATGIGLYMCKSAADMLGIDIAVESVIHQGSCFYLYFKSGINRNK